MFAEIAPAYDRTNAVLSMGVHGRWRRKTVELSGAGPGHYVLDCATGTGELACAFAERVLPTGRVVGTDLTEEMVRLAPAKAARREVEADFQVADALALPYAAASFDIVSIAFGIRNVDDPLACLREMARVTKTGGRIAILEFGQPRGVVSAPFRAYSRHVIPRVGGLLTGNREAYEYLPRTSASFPAGEDFLDLMRDAGCFAERTAKALTGGIAWVYVGTVA